MPSTTLDALNLGMVALNSYISTRMGLKERDGLEEEERDCSWPQLDRGMAAGVNGGMGLSDELAETAESTQGSGPWGQKQEVQRLLTSSVERTHLQKGLPC